MRHLVLALPLALGLVPTPAPAAPNFPLYFAGTYCADGLFCDNLELDVLAGGNLRARLTAQGFTQEVGGHWSWNPGTQVLSISSTRFWADLRRNGTCANGAGEWDMILIGPTRIDVDVCLL